MNQEETYARRMEASLDIVWPKKSSYHPATIDFWRKVDTLLSNPTLRILPASITKQECANFRRFAYRASNRIPSGDSETMLVRQEDHLGGSDI